MARKVGGYVGWEEVVVSGEKGRREVHYYLRDSRGSLDLAVVGWEKSARHMSYSVPATFFRSCGPDAVARLPAAQASSSPSPSSCISTVSSGSATPLRSPPSPPSSPSPPATLSLKWRSRREVIDWLSSIVSGASMYETLDEHWYGKEMDIAGDYSLKGISSEHMRLHSKEFSWLGSFWTCKKQKKHYSSFRRYGFTISVHDFVYVMAEENKRLVAYVEDLYEDLKARKKVVVRWFHKVDEVNMILPPDVNDREIFFSLCLQDLSVECIDGLAAVLSAQHFEKYLNEVVQSPFKPFLCCRQVDDEDVKPFDITCLRGYWRQELLRCLDISTKPQPKSSSCSMPTANDGANDSLPNHKPKRKDRLVISEKVNGRLRLKFRRVGDSTIVERRSQDCFPPAPLPPKKSPTEKIHQHLSPGCHVEVLSQDSGLRGCWFRCEILKRYQDKVKVKYHDLRDADEKGNLEEWILASRVAVADKLGIRLQQRTMVRPQPPSESTISPVYHVGSVVDAWWNDGWWEGIVTSKETDQRFCVYFPGEQRTITFGASDLRRSRDWSSSGWSAIGDRPELVCSLLAITVRADDVKDSDKCTPSQRLGPSEIESSTMTNDEKIACKIRCRELSIGREGEVTPTLVPDDGLPARLKWSTSRKRCPRGFNRSSPNHRTSGRCGSIKDASACMKLLVSQPLMPENNCKFRGDIFFSDSAAISSLVVSR